MWQHDSHFLLQDIHTGIHTYTHTEKHIYNLGVLAQFWLCECDKYDSANFSTHMNRDRDTDWKRRMQERETELGRERKRDRPKLAQNSMSFCWVIWQIFISLVLAFSTLLSKRHFHLTFLCKWQTYFEPGKTRKMPFVVACLGTHTHTHAHNRHTHATCDVWNDSFWHRSLSWLNSFRKSIEIFRK